MGPCNQNEPIIVAFMGPTGTGKSSFVNLLTGREDAKVAKGLMSGTSEVASYSFIYKTRTFTLVDTPGFDDSHRSDKEVLQTLMKWLEISFRSGQRITGILYFHRIADPRMQGSALSNLYAFQRLCGKGCFANVVLGTTFWQNVTEDVGARRQQELVDSDEFWGLMVKKGSRIERIPESATAARDLVWKIATKVPVVLAAQREIVIEGKGLNETSACQGLQKELEVKAKQALYEKEQKELQDRQKARLEEMERKRKAEELEEKAEHERKIRAQEAQRKELERQRAREEEEHRHREQAAKEATERMERERKELAERMEKLKIEAANTQRRNKIQRYHLDLNAQLKALYTAFSGNNLLCKLREPCDAYTAICCNCFKNIGVGNRYDCQYEACNPGWGFCLCSECHSAPGVYCDDKDHFTNMVLNVQSDRQGGCKRVVAPTLPSTPLWCSRCGTQLGAVYLHCCHCDNDDFDMCVNCALNFRTCKKSWSLSGHPLDVVFKYNS